MESRNFRRPRNGINYFKNHFTKIYGNTLVIPELVNQRVIPEVINSLKRLHFKFGHDNIIIDLTDVTKVYPYPTVPIAGYLHYFREKYGVEFNIINPPTYIKKIHFTSPSEVDSLSGDNFSFLDRIWMFKTSSEVHRLVDGIISSLRKSIDCENGVLDACTWGLNEIMDNVIQHSEQNIGFVMVQVHKETSQINVCIFDYGIGIYQSLRDSVYKPRNAADAISLSIQEGVTRDKKVGQGNGMWGLYNIINLNDGDLFIISGKGGLVFNNQQKSVKSYKDIILLNPQQQSTTVFFKIRVNKEVSVKRALNGHEMVDMYIESLENEFEQIIYRVGDQKTGTGTRQSGERLRHEVINIYKTSQKQVIVDFDGVGIIASSFADEFIGKLVAELGLFQFQNIVRLKNMNQNIQSIVQRSLSQRLAESLNGLKS